MLVVIHPFIILPQPSLTGKMKFIAGGEYVKRPNINRAIG